MSDSHGSHGDHGHESHDHSKTSHNQGIGGGHAHGPGGGHSHVSGNKSTLWIVLLLSAGYLVAEIVGGIVSGSLALLADAGHMALDVAAIAIGLFAIKISQRPPTLEKTFGYYRAEILAAALNGATLFAVSLWIFYEAYERFSSPPEVKGSLMAIVAAGGLVVNMIGIWLTAKSSRDSLNMRGVWLHLITDTLGSVAALLAAVLVWKFDWRLADPIISIVIGLLILWGAWKLLVDCVNVLLVAVPEGVSVKAITADINELAGIDSLHDLHVWAVSTKVNALSAHVRVKKGTDHLECLNAITDLLRDKHQIDHVTLQLENPEFTHKENYCAPGQSFHVRKATE